MSEDVCPYCGAIQDTDPGSSYVYTCRTAASGGTATPIYLRSLICYERELTRLKERLAVAEGLLQAINHELLWNISAEAFLCSDFKLRQLGKMADEASKKIQDFLTSAPTGLKESQPHD